MKAVNKTQHQAYETTDYGSVAQLVSALPCHGRGRRFESGQSRKLTALLAGTVRQSAFGRGTPRHVAGSTPAFLGNGKMAEYVMSARRAVANRGVYSLGDCYRHLNTLPRSVMAALLTLTQTALVRVQAGQRA